MSATSETAGVVRARLRAVDLTRGLALGGILLLCFSFLQVMYHFIDVVGVPFVFLALVAVTLVAATVLAHLVRPRVAVLIGAAMLVAGLAWYLTQMSGEPQWLALLADALSLFAGQSLLRISNIYAWVIGVAPGPIFVTWYFAVRRWYAPSVVVGGATLGFFVLTGDATVITAITGVIGGTAALGFGDLEKRGETIGRGETVVTIVAVMIVVPGLISVVPATAGAALPGDGLFGEGDGTLEANLIEAEERIDIQGQISLSPRVRFSVTSTEAAYWRVASYDRYTGEGWVRTGGTDRYDGGIRSGPPGRSVLITQVVRAEDRLAAMPAAWKPVSVSGASDVRVTGAGDFVPEAPLEPGETYTVRSRSPRPSPRELQAAGTDYPDHIEETYLQLPESTPDRVFRRTDVLTANAETPYETARTIELWLETNRNYSLDVREPRGNIADAFLFEMDAGYCTYYATTMVTMLRAEGIPARFVTGYTPGERVSEDRWVVRGQNSHAWVEVYFPDHGWVRFDPTPGGPREAAESRELQTAREQNETNVDTSETTPEGEWTPQPTPTPAPLTPPDSANGTIGSNGTTPTPSVPGGIIRDPDLGSNITVTPESGETNGSNTSGDRPPLLPTRHQIGLGLLAAVGLVAGARRTQAVERAYRAVWVRYQPRSDDPVDDIERAWDRLEYHLEHEAYRPRRSQETVRDYLVAIHADDEVRRVARIRERARYRGEASEADADEAVRLVDDVVR